MNQRKRRNRIIHRYLSKRRKKIHGDKYDYSNVNYTNSQTKVCIICPEHGEFWQTPVSHLQGCGCRKCADNFTKDTRRYTTEQFIKKAHKIHGDKYDYSKVEYINTDTPVRIICKTCGSEFVQTPHNHLNGSGCKRCFDNNKRGKSQVLTTEQFIRKAINIHQYKYDYSKVKYVNSSTKVCIICKQCGREFQQTPAHHLSGEGCIVCNNHKSSEAFIADANKKYNFKYDYTLTDYKDSRKEVIIICHEKFKNGKEHGQFKRKPSEHLFSEYGGCPRCNKRMYKLNTEDFINKAQDVHGNKYDYSKVRYVNTNTPVTIICHKKDCNCNEHGEFLQTPGSHLYGQGCPICNNSSLEREVEGLLVEMGIDFIREYKIKTSSKKRQRLDFYLINKQIAIECQGIQHFEPIEFFGGVKGFNENLRRDKIKKEWCEKNNIKLIYYSNEEKYCNINTLEQLKIELNK